MCGGVGLHKRLLTTTFKDTGLKGYQQSGLVIAHGVSRVMRIL